MISPINVRRMNSEELFEFMDMFKLNNKTATISFPSVITYGNGNIYKGEILIQSNTPNGYGFMNYTNGDWFASKWTNNLANGSGIYIYANGTDVRGTWNNGKLQSIKCKIQYYNGDVYNGPYKNDTLYGIGTFWRKEDGELFHGKFVDGNRCGYGISKWPNGSIYDGNWRNDTFDGEGTLITPTRTYYGPWLEGAQNADGCPETVFLKS